MKKIFALFILVVALFSTAACQKSNEINEPTENLYKVLYITNCEDCNIEPSYGTIKEAPVVSNPGYSLDGWYKTSDFSGEKVSFPFTPDKHTSIYAKWTLVDADSAIRHIFERTYNKKSRLSENESIEKSDSRYIYKKELEDNNCYYSFQFSFNTDSSTLQGMLTKKQVSYYKGEMIILTSVNNTFTYGNFKDGVSILNEASIYHKGYLANRNLYTAEFPEITNHKPQIKFTPNKNNRSSFYIFTMTPSIEVSTEGDEDALRTLFDDMIYLCNRFLGEPLQVC